MLAAKACAAWLQRIASHRIAVMRQGRLAGVVDGPTAAEESIMRVAAGVGEEAA